MTKHKRVLAVLVSGAVALGVAAAVKASIPDSSGVIHGCYEANGSHGLPTGTVRVIDTSKPTGNCASWELPLSWNQHGPTGSRGPTGVRGPTGPQGISLWANVKSDGTLVNGTATGASRVSTGNYTVTFSQVVWNCAAVANVGGFNGFDSATNEVAQVGFNTPNVVVVNLTQLDGTQTDSAFHLILAC